MSKEEKQRIAVEQVHAMSVIGFAETLDDAIRERRRLDATGVPHEHDPFTPVVAKYQALGSICDKIADQLDEAVRLLTEWTEAHARGRLFDETSDFLRRVRP